MNTTNVVKTQHCYSAIGNVEQKFTDFINRHEYIIDRALMHYMPPSHKDYDDIKQETRLQVWKLYPSFTEKKYEDPCGWVYNVAKFTFMTHWQKQNLHVKRKVGITYVNDINPNLLIDESDSELDLIEQQKQKLFFHAVDNLPGDLSRIIKLYVAGQTRDGICSILSISKMECTHKKMYALILIRSHIKEREIIKDLEKMKLLPFQQCLENFLLLKCRELAAVTAIQYEYQKDSLLSFTDLLTCRCQIYQRKMSKRSRGMVIVHYPPSGIKRSCLKAYSTFWNLGFLGKDISTLQLLKNGF